MIFTKLLELDVKVIAPYDWQLFSSRLSRGAITLLQFPLAQLPVHSRPELSMSSTCQTL